MKESELKVTETVLSPGKYVIPEGYRGFIIKGVLTVQEKKDRHLRVTDKRCKDCTHRILGKCRQQWYETEVCEMRPKGLIGKTQMYYRARENDHICQHFKEKKK